MTPQSPIVAGLEEYEIKIAESQDEYETLPALPIDNGQRIVTRWRLTWRDRLIALLNGDIYLHVWTFGGPLQPVNLDVEPPQLVIDRNAKPVPPEWQDDLSSSEAHVEAMEQLDDLTSGLKEVPNA